MLLGLALLLVGPAACKGRQTSSASAPDVVLVVIDSLRVDRLRKALDGSASWLPNLRRLADDAVVYDRATSPATWCIPAHASLLTGRWPSFHGAERRVRHGALVEEPLDAEIPTLAELLRERGLRTAAFVPGRGDLDGAHGFERGFDDFVNDPALASPPHMAEGVARWLDAQSGAVFLFVSLDALRQAKIPEGDGGDLRLVPRAEVTNAVVKSGKLPQESRDALVADYDRELESVDAAVGEILAALQSDGRYAGAMVIVTADHGEMLGEHGLAGHGWPPFEDALNVPLLVKYPDGHGAGTHVERRVSTLGVFASVLDAVGVAAPDDVQSRPLDDHHPVWAEDVDRKGRRVRAGYDGLRKKIIRVTSDDVDVACTYDMYMDAAELNPDCSSGDDGALQRAMASFSKKPRPGDPSGIARAPSKAEPVPGARVRATN